MSPESGFTNITQPSTDRLVFVEDGHKYLLDNTELTSVTTMLKTVGIIETGFYTKNGADNGKRRHLLTELMDKGVLDWGSVLEEDLPYAKGWAEFCRDYSFKPEHIEIPVYHEIYMYAGTIDRLGMVDDAPAIVDIKTGSRLERWVELQLLLYSFMVTYGEVRPRLLAVHLREGKEKNYRVVEYGYDNMDTALAILKINAWKVRNV